MSSSPSATSDDDRLFLRDIVSKPFDAVTCMEFMTLWGIANRVAASETKPSESPGVLWYKLDMAARHFDQVEDEELSEACREAQRLTLVSPSATRRSIDPVQAAIDITREVAELPDRNSPEGEPEMMLVKDSELRRIVHNVLVEALRG